MSDFKIVSLLNPSVVVLSGATGPAIAAGGSTQTSGTIFFSNANNVSFGLVGGTMTASIVPGGGLGDGYNILAAGSQTANTTGSVKFNDGGGVSFGMSNNSVITATVATNYMASNQSSNFVAASNSSLFQQTSATSNITSNAFAASATTKFAGTGTTFAGTNASGSMTVDSNGVNFAISVAAGGGAGDGYNSAQFTNSTANSTMPLVWAGNSNGSGNVTIGLTGSTITMSAPSGGGAGDGWNIIAAGGSTNASTGTVVFGNANGISFGLNLGTVTASYTVPNVPAQTVDTNKAGTGYTSSTQAGVTVGVTNNTNGLSMAWPLFITTYVNDLTSGRAGVGFTSASTAGVVPTATLSTNGLSMGIPAWITTYVAQTNQTAASGNIAGVGTTFAGTNVSGSMTLNSAGLNLALSAGAGGGAGDGVNIVQIGTTGTTGTSFSASTGTVFFNGSNNITVSQNGSNQIVIVGPNVSQYLTTARASNDAVGLNTALTANGVSWTVNSSGISLNVPAFLTTAAQSNHSHNFATTTTNGSVAVVATANSVGATVAMPPWITTYVAQTNQTVASGNIAGVGTTFAGTNATATLGLNSAGLAMSLSVAAGGAINQTGPNFAVAGSTVTSGTVLFSNANGVSWGIAGQTLTASVNAGGGAGATINDYEIYPLGNNTSFSSYSQNALYFQRIMPMNNVSMTAIEMLISMSSVTSSISHSVGHTMSYGVYTKGTGASTSQMQLMATSSFYIQASYSSNLSGGYTVGQGTNSFTASSAGTVFGSVLSGQKIMSLPFSTSLATGGDYYMAFAQSSASVGNTGAIRMSCVVQTIATNGSWGQLDIGGARVSNSSYSNEPYMVSYSATSGVWPATLAKSDMRLNANSINQMYALLEA